MTDAALNTRNASTLCGHRGGNAARGRSATLQLVLLLGLAGTARAGTINVNTTIIGVNNDGQCSLIEAIDNANAANVPSPAPGVVYPTHNDCSGATDGANTIVLQAGTYTYTAPNQSAESGAASYRFYWYGPSALPAIASTILGNGAVITRSGSTPFRFFYVGADPANANTLDYTSPGPGNLTLQGQTLSNGLAQGGSSGLGGGGAGAGGAIFSQGKVTLNQVTLSYNTAQGGDSTGNGSFGGGGIGEDASNTINNFSGGGFGGGFSGIGTAGGAATSTTGGSGGGFAGVADSSGFSGGGGGRQRQWQRQRQRR